MAGLPIQKFVERLNQLMPVLMREFGRRMVKDLSGDDVTFPQFFILEFLHREGESKMSALACCAGVSTPAMTGIADRLVKAGYVERSFDPEDRRIIKVKLTSRGLAFIKKINQHRKQTAMKIFGQVSEKDREDYLRVLTRIHEVLTSKPDGKTL